MKTQKHTAEKWTLENLTGPLLRVTAGEKGFVIAMITGDCISHFIGNTEEAIANAKLIAAAPDMLEALNELVKNVSPYIYKLGVKKGFSEIVALEAAKTAIRKATE